MLSRHVLATALAVTCAALLAPGLPAYAQSALPEPVVRALRSAAIPADALGVLVLRDDDTVLAHLADRPMQPASVMKLATTLVALEQLGPAFRGRTELRTTGTLQGGVLRGDLFLRGGADADFSTEALTAMLRSLRYQGIRTLQGRLVVDRQLFNPARTDLGVAPFDESPEAYYNVIPDALLVNKNMLQLDLRSTAGLDGRRAQRVRVTMQPELDGVTVDTDMTLVDADCAQWEDGWKTPDTVPQPDGGIKVMLHGTFPKNCVASESINVIDRQEYLDRLVRHTWTALGGNFAGTTADTPAAGAVDGMATGGAADGGTGARTAAASATIEGVTPPDARLLAAHVSRALPEIVRDTNKPSDNALARTLFLSLGALAPDPVLGSRPLPGSAVTTFSRADATVRAWMRAHGIDDTGLVLDNGAGLSRIEHISPVQLAGVLQAGLRSDWAPEFLASIPIVAIDGTMRKRLHDSPAAGHARMKSGTMRNVAAVAGYVPDGAGRRCVLVAIINSERVSNGRGRMVLDALVDWLARADGPAPASGDAGGVGGADRTTPSTESASME